MLGKRGKDWRWNLRVWDQLQKHPGQTLRFQRTMMKPWIQHGWNMAKNLPRFLRVSYFSLIEKQKRRKFSGWRR